MLRLGLLAALLVVTLAACDWWNQANPITQTVNIKDPCCDDTGTSTAPAVANLQCVRVLQPTGIASTCRLEWTGGGTFDALAVRQSDSSQSFHPGVSSGTEIDPGIPGQGAGTWTIRLLDDAGNSLASTSVDLDS